MVETSCSCSRPAVALSQVHLLQVGVQPIAGEECGGVEVVFVQQGHLRQRRRGHGGGDALGGDQHARALVDGGRQLGLHHVLVEGGRASNRLAGVVDEEVESVVGVEDACAQRLDTWCVAQVDAVDLQAMAPLGEVGLAGVAGGGVDGEPGHADDAGTGPQQHDGRLVADLDPAAGDQGGAACQVAGLGALGVVEVAALQAHLVVEPVDPGVAGAAHVADLLFADLAQGRAVLWRRRCRSGCGAIGERGAIRALGDPPRGEEDGVLAELADPGPAQQGPIGVALLDLLPTLVGAGELAAGVLVRLADPAGGHQQALAQLGLDGRQQAAVLDDGLEQLCGFEHGAGVFDGAGIGHRRPLSRGSAAAALRASG